MSLSIRACVSMHASTALRFRGRPTDAEGVVGINGVNDPCAICYAGSEAEDPDGENRNEGKEEQEEGW